MEDIKQHPLTGKLVHAGELEDLCLVDIQTGQQADFMEYRPGNAEFFDLVNASRFEK